MKYKIGQILTSNTDAVIEKALSGEKVTIPKGNKIIIGADKFAHHMKNGFIQPLQEDSSVEGYSAEGIAEWIYLFMRHNFPLDEMLEDYDEDKNSFTECITEALEEIGFYEK